jgi:hypothetical protein
VIEARFTEAPNIGFQTRADDLDDIVEIAAFAVEAAITARTSVGSILGLTRPALMAVVSQETELILSSIPRQS